MSYQQLHEDPDVAIADIVDRFHAMAEHCDAVLIVGSDYPNVTSPSELSVNARIAVNLGAPVVLAVRAKDRTPDEVVHVVSCAWPNWRPSTLTPRRWSPTVASLRSWRPSRQR